MAPASDILQDIYKFESFIYIGKEVKRIDSLEKVTGTAKYFKDYYYKDMLCAKVFTSYYPHAKIKNIDTSSVLKIPGIERVITWKDIPGSNLVGYYIPDQPLLAEEKVRYYGEPIGIIVGEKEDNVLLAREMIKIDYEPLPAVFDVFEAIENKVRIHEKGNIVFQKKILKGDVEKGFEQSAVIVENNYNTSWQDHAYIEPEGAIAIPEDSGIKIIGVQQHPHLAQMIVARVLDIKPEQVEIITPLIGGAFGGKDDTGPWVCAQAALAAYLTKRPVVLSYDREDSILIHPKRFPFYIKYKSGASEDGLLKAIDVKIIADTGAYSNRSPLVLFRAMLCSSGPYKVPNANVEGKLVYTNKVLGGSFRGFGDPEVHFAAESQMDELAEKLGMDPVEFRLKNILEPNSETMFGQRVEEVGIKEALMKVSEKSNWRSKFSEYRRFNEKSKNVKRGIGIACVWHGTTITSYRPDGSPRPDWSSVRIAIRTDGKVEVHTGLVEIGQGTHTAIAQTVSEVLSLPSLDYVLVINSSNAPDTWATHSSRGTSYGSLSVFYATLKLRKTLSNVAANILACETSEIVFNKGYIYCSHSPEKKMEWHELIKRCYEMNIDLTVTETVWHNPRGKFDPETLTGYIYPVISYSVFISEVEVDIETGHVNVIKVWPALSCGRIINPIGVKAQIVGGFLQGLGMTLMEEIIFNNGVPQNINFIDYLVPSASDSPIFEEPIFIEDIHPYGLFGSKGVGEMGIIGAPASIANAIAFAVGRRCVKLPINPVYLYSLLHKRDPINNKDV